MADIILDEGIYPRQKIDHKRVSLFAENIRDNFPFDPIEVEPHPEKPGKYRILDGAHRWCAYKATGVMTLQVIIKHLDGTDPLLYAAGKAIGPRSSLKKRPKTRPGAPFKITPRSPHRRSDRPSDAHDKPLMPILPTFGPWSRWTLTLKYFA